MSVLVPFIFWSKNCEYGYEYGVSERFERALMVCYEGEREREIFLTLVLMGMLKGWK